MTTNDRSHDGPTATRPDTTSTPRLLAFIGALIAQVAQTASVAATRAFSAADRWLHESKKSLYGIAVTRILFGLTGLGLLLTNFATRYYSFGSGSAWNRELVAPISDFPKIWVFSAFHSAMGNDLLYSALYVLLIGLSVLFILGWRFRIVLPVFFFLWVGFIEANDMIGDQGDNMFRIAMILLFFADPAARWSLDARRRARKGEWFREGSAPRQIGIVGHNLALVALAAQVIFVYTSGALFKAGGSPWREGWAIYHPLETARFGTWPALSDFFMAWGPAVAFLTLGTLFLQAAFPFMLLTRPTRLIALFGMLGFHLGIAVLMGLPWFSLTMVAIDAIFIRDRSWAGMGKTLRDTWRLSRSTHASPDLGAADAVDEKQDFAVESDREDDSVRLVKTPAW
ncbi:HTTM domain-containing protein [Microbacterium sp. NPDC087665]|uniref:HTTM domain-containing protein n=1 Tax=Microbacterium sp. NPDC087665 TaxID=3364194 RepID=UPI0037F2F31E